MKHLLFIFMSPLLMSHFLKASTSENKIKITHLKGPLYIVEDSYWIKENSVLFIGKEGITIIGTSWTPATADEIISQIKKISHKPIQYAVNTHYHVDRAGGNASFKNAGAKIISTSMTKDLLEINWTKSIKELKKTWPEFPDIPLVPPDTTFDTKLVLEAGQIELLYFGPSHSKDGIVAYFPKEKVLDADCIVKEKLGSLDSADLMEYPKTLAKIKKLDFSIVIAGHWSPIHGREIFDQYLTLLSSVPKP